MHRHGYRGRKFHRETDQRSALIKSLAEALIINESIETTLPKAKEVVRYTEKLISKAKKADLHNRRQIISALQTKASAHKLIDAIAPQLSKRNSGYFRVIKARLRRGDGAQMARVSFVDELKAVEKQASTKKTTKPAKTAAKKPAKKRVAKISKTQPGAKLAPSDRKATKQTMGGATKATVRHRRSGAR